MKKIIFLFSFFLIISFTACDEDRVLSCGDTCSLQNIAANADCMAKALNQRCSYFGCTGSSIDIDIHPSDCTYIDCVTLECENIEIMNLEGNLINELPGLLMDLSVDEETGFPIGIFKADEFEEEVICNRVIAYCS